MNAARRICPTAIVVVLILACVAGAQVSSTNAPPSAVGVAPAPSSVSYAGPPAVDSTVSKLRSAIAMSTFGSSDGSQAVFIVPAEEIAVEDLGAITEDVNVMARIFEKRLRQAELLPSASPFPIFVRSGYRTWGAGGGSARTMYLQGYGILFMMDVDFPLEPGPETETAEEPAEPETDVDPVWTNAREEIYEPHRTHHRSTPDESRPQYSAERVENLKTAIISALVHAANIRGLTPEESIIVTLTGSPTPDIVVSETITIPGTAQIVVKGKNDELKIVDGPLPGNAPTVLTIRAKGSDIKALAAGQITEPQFRQRVQILSHPLLKPATVPSVPTSITQTRRSSGAR